MKKTEDICYLGDLFARFYPIGATGTGGVTRLGYSAVEDEMHEALAQIGAELGLERRIDAIGNSWFSLPGTPKERYVIGSHLDSVIDGGRYDGVAGVLAGLLVLHWAKEEGLRLPVELVAFRCEESANFGMPIVGSSLLTQYYPFSNVAGKKGRDGRALGEIFAEKGYSTTPPLPEGMRGYLELHIEQGRVLEDAKLPIGVVVDVAGPRRYNLIVRGMAEHSGATPMPLRCDALCAAAELILAIEALGRAESGHSSVSTVGVINNAPNALNVIPGEVQLGIDLRGIDIPSLDRMSAALTAAIDDVSARRGVTCFLEKTAETRPVPLTPSMRDGLAKAAEALSIPYCRMASGAGHDAMYYTKLCPVGMLFIPCRGGVSHNRTEFAELGDLVKGAAIFYRFLKEVSL